MMTVSLRQRLEQTIDALNDELRWGLRCFHAAKVIDKTDLRLRSHLFEIFYFSCLDQASLILSRLVIARTRDDDSINLQYLANQAGNKPSLFRYAKAGELRNLAHEQERLFELHRPLIDLLKDQRDQNIAHLDRRHVNDPDWRRSQAQIDFAQAAKLYQDLIGVMTTYFRLYYGKELEFEDWETILESEFQALIDFYEAYRSKA